MIDPNVVSILTNLLGGVGATAFTTGVVNLKDYIAKSNSIDPIPKFELLFRDTPGTREVYLRVTDYSHNWVELALVSGTNTRRILLASEGSVELPSLEPSGMADYLLCRIDSTVPSTDLDTVSFKVAFKQANAKEKLVEATIFDGNASDFENQLEDIDPIYNDLTISAGAVSKACGYTANAYKEDLIDERLEKTSYYTRSTYKDQLNDWAKEVEITDDNVEAIFAKKNFVLSVTNSSKDREYRDIEITLLFPEDLRLCKPPKDSVEPPKLQLVPTLQIDSYFTIPNLDPELFIRGRNFTSEKLEEEIELVRANQTYQILNEDDEYKLIWFGQDKCFIGVEVRFNGKYYRFEDIELETVSSESE